MTSAEIPSSAIWFAAANARCTVAPYVTIVTSDPARTIFALPNGIMKFDPGYEGLLYACRERCLCSRKMTGPSQRIAVRRRPLAPTAVAGHPTRRPGQGEKSDAPVCE